MGFFANQNSRAAFAGYAFFIAGFRSRFRVLYRIAGFDGKNRTFEVKTVLTGKRETVALEGGLPVIAF